MDELGASIYSATRSVPRPWIRTPANRRSVAAGGAWWRRALADAFLDKLGLLQRAAGARVWLGRRRPWQGLLRPPACCHGRPDGGAVGRQEGARAALRRGRGRACRLCEGSGQNERGEAAVGRGDSVRARAKRALWARPAHARQVLDAMPTRSRPL